MATPDRFLEMLARNPRGWGNLPAAPEQAPQAIFDEYGQPHDQQTGHPLYDNTAPQKSAGDSLHDIAMSPVNMALAPVHALSSLSELGGFPNPQNPQNQQDVSALVASMFGGNAMAPARAGEAAVANAGHLRPGLSLDGHKGPSSTNYQLMMNDQNIGRAYVREYPETVQIGNFSINPEHQRQGIGTEVQREIARLHGKPNVPDGTLSDIELARWQKNDPAAVADYVKPFEGASSSIPRTGSNAYWASQGRGVVPGTRAAAGELFSDTGKPSILGSALAGAKGADDTLVRMYHGTNAENAAKIHDEGFSGPVFLSDRSSQAQQYGDHVMPLDVRKEALKLDFDMPGAYLHDLEGANAHISSEGMSIDDFLNAKKYSFGVDEQNSIFEPNTGKKLFSDTGKPSILGSALAAMFGGKSARPGEASAMTALADTSAPAFNAIDNPLKLFHGTAGPVDHFNTRDLWASPSESTAGRYADQAAAKTGADKNIIPLELHSDKIMRPAQRWMDENAARKQALDGGYDAVNWGPFESGGGDYYQVVRPNTVRHAETGETLFSDTGKPSVLGSALAGAGRQVDDLGFYSKALEEAQKLPQAKGTPEQMLAMLKRAGVKDAEINATGLADALAGKAAVTRDEIVKHLDDNKIGLNETTYAHPYDTRVTQADLSSTKWQGYSLDPENPTYQETVLHLPQTDGPVYQSGHWKEPNVVAHARTSMQKDAAGNNVFAINELQSDWGQRLRETGPGEGVWDGPKVANLTRQVENAKARLDDMDKAVAKASGLDPAFSDIHRINSLKEAGHHDLAAEFGAANSAYERLSSELYNAKAVGTPPHPLVNTTDAWVNTAMKRLLHQAAKSDAHSIAIPSGETVLSYGMGGEEAGMKYAYDQMYPKNMRNLLAKIDPEAANMRDIDFYPHTGNAPLGVQGRAFPITQKVRDHVLNNGQALFSDTGKPSPLGAALAGAKTADIAPETFLAAGHPSSSLVPTRPQGGHLEGNPLDQILAASPGQLEQGGRSLIESDRLPGSFGASLDEINAIRKAYAEGKPLASNWYVHGRHGTDKLSENNPIQMTKDYETMLQYGQGYSDPPKGSGWAIAPTDKANVLDFTSTDSPDLRSATARMIRDGRNGNNPIIDDVRGSLENPTPREISQAIREGFAPDRIVDSAQAFDNSDWYGALLNAASPDFVKTPNGAVGFLDKDAGKLKAVRLFSDTGKPSPLGAALAGAQDDDQASHAAIMDLLKKYGVTP